MFLKCGKSWQNQFILYGKGRTSCQGERIYESISETYTIKHNYPYRNMLQTKRIRLRAVEPEDLDLMYLIENDTDLWKYGASTVPYSRFALRQFIEQTRSNIYQDGQLRLAIETTEGITIGFVDIQELNMKHLRAEVGIVIVSEWQGKGYGSEALELLCNYVDTHLNLHQLYAIVSESNESACKLFESRKFKPSGTLAEWLKDGSSYSNVYIFTRIFRH